MDDLLAPLLADAVEQASELRELDAVRAEVWASDLVALAAETGPDGVHRLIEALAATGGSAAAAALWAIDAVTGGVDPGDAALEPAPRWAADLGTSTGEAAWLLEERRGVSAAFRFVDQADDRHVVIVDLVPGRAGAEESAGEVVVGPIEWLDGLDEPDAGIRSESVSAVELARRVARAVRHTAVPTASLVANGRLLAARLAGLGVDGVDPPAWVERPVPSPPAADPEADAWARQVLERALGSLPGAEPAAVLVAASMLRDAARDHEPLARWLAASRGPVDLDEPDLTVVTAALAATVKPADLAPLDPAQREAVLELEWADWLGAVVGLVRSGPGASVAPDALVDQVNRCPEVTSTIPGGDRDRVAWAFGVATEAWEPLGLAADGVLTEFATRVLPAALRVAWGGSCDP